PFLHTVLPGRGSGGELPPVGPTAAADAPTRCRSRAGGKLRRPPHLDGRGAGAGDLPPPRGNRLGAQDPAVRGQGLRRPLSGRLGLRPAAVGSAVSPSSGGTGLA